MATVYQTFDKHGRPHKRFKYRFKDWTGRRKGGTGTTNKTETQKLADRLEMRAKEIREGIRPKPKASDKARALSDVAEEYMQWGTVQGGRGGRPWSESHAEHVRRRLDFWLERLSGKALQDVTLPAVERVLRELHNHGRDVKRQKARSCSNRCRAEASRRRRRGEKVKPRPDACCICGGDLPEAPRRGRGLAGKSLQGYRETIKALTRWARRRGYLEADPLEFLDGFDLTPQSQRRALSCQEVARLLASCESAGERLFYETALATGYRMGELRRLTVESVNVPAGTLTLGAGQTKNRKPASQPVGPALLARLAEHAEGRVRKEPLFDLPKYTKVNARFHAALKTAGISTWSPLGRVDFHALRATFVTLLVESGANIREVQSLARHSTPTLTMARYAKTRQESLRAVAERVGAVISGPASHTGAKRKAAGAEGLDVSALSHRELEPVGSGARGGSRTPTGFPTGS